MLRSRGILLVFCTALILSGQVLAETKEVQFSTDELPSESVTPVLDFPQAVQSRLLTFSQKFDVTPFYGWMLDEPFYQKEFFGVQANYSTDEVNSFGFRFQAWTQGISSYGKQFEESSANLRFDWARGPQAAAMFNYEAKFMYGKISIAKGTVLPTVVYGILQAGTINYGNRNLPLFGLGLGQKFFLTKRWGLQFQLQQWLHQQLDPLSANIRGDQATQASIEKFQNKTEPSTFLDVGLICLF